MLANRSDREESGTFVIEGEHLLEEAIRSGWQVVEVFVDPDRPIKVGLEHLVVRRLEAGVLDRVATTESPQGVLAEVRRAPMPDRPRSGWMLVLDRVSDPGNLGTLIRSAEAFGASAVGCTKGTVDPFNPKSLRSAAGATFHVPLIVDIELRSLADWGFKALGTTSHEDARPVPIENANLQGDVAILLGNEARGLDPDAPVDQWVSIPQQGRSESLNVAMAGTVIAYVVSSRRVPPATSTSVS